MCQTFSSMLQLRYNSTVSWISPTKQHTVHSDIFIVCQTYTLLFSPLRPGTSHQHRLPQALYASGFTPLSTVPKAICTQFRTFLWHSYLCIPARKCIMGSFPPLLLSYFWWWWDPGERPYSLVRLIRSSTAVTSLSVSLIVVNSPACTVHFFTLTAVAQEVKAVRVSVWACGSCVDNCFHELWFWAQNQWAKCSLRKLNAV